MQDIFGTEAGVQYRRNMCIYFRLLDAVHLFWSKINFWHSTLQILFSSTAKQIRIVVGDLYILVDRAFDILSFINPIEIIVEVCYRELEVTGEEL